MQPQPRDMTEQRLLDRVQSGDAGAFEALIAEIEAPLFGYALNMVRNRAEAEDIAQESLFRLYKAARAGQVRRAPRAYVFSTAHNLAVDYQRRQLNMAPEPLKSSVAASVGAERTLLRAEIHKALAALPVDHRSALMLREFGGLSYAEVAAALNASQEQVKVWIYRARRKLVRLLDREGQFLGDSKDGARASV